MPSHARVVLFLVSAMAGAAPAFAQTSDAVTVALTLRDSGCALASREEGDFVNRTGLEEDRVVAAIIRGVGDGWVIADGATETLSLVPALCDPAGAGDMRATLTAVMRVNGCRIAESEADTQFPQFGLTQDMTRETGTAMLAAGELTETGDNFVLSTSLCEGVGADLPSPRGMMLDIMRAAGCSSAPDAMLDAMIARGNDPEVSQGLLDTWTADGTLIASDTDAAMLTLSPDLCSGAPASVPFMDPVDQMVAMMRRLPDCAGSGEALELAFEGIAELLPREVIAAAEDRFDVMFLAGDIIERDDTLLLSAEMCAGEPGAVVRLTTVIADTLRSSGCEMGEDALLAAAALPGLSADAIGAVAELMVQDNVLTDLGRSVALSPELCAAAPSPEPAADPGAASSLVDTIAAVSDDSAAFLVDQVLRAAGCAVGTADLAALEANLVAPLAQVMGITPTAPAEQGALRMLAVRGFERLQADGKAVWDTGTSAMRLTTCF